MRGGGPSFSSSWRRGTAIRWPSSSTRTISSTATSDSACGIAEGLGAVGGDLARVAQVAQQLLELDALVALEAPGAGDLALADRRGAVADESQQFVAGRDFALSHRFRCGAAASVLALAALRLGAAFFLAVLGFVLCRWPCRWPARQPPRRWPSPWRAFLARAGFLPPPLAARSASSDTAWSSVSSSGLRSRGTVALMPPCFT